MKFPSAMADIEAPHIDDEKIKEISERVFHGHPEQYRVVDVVDHEKITPGITCTVCGHKLRYEAILENPQQPTHGRVSLGSECAKSRIFYSELCQDIVKQIEGLKYDKMQAFIKSRRAELEPWFTMQRALGTALRICMVLLKSRKDKPFSKKFFVAVNYPWELHEASLCKPEYFQKSQQAVKERCKTLFSEMKIVFDRGYLEDMAYFDERIKMESWEKYNTYADLLSAYELLPSE